MPTKLKKPNKFASALGKLSAKKRKELGHDSEYYKNLAKKRWDKASQK